MHLEIDIREACRTTPTGKGIWTLGLVTELLRRPISLTLRADSPLPDSLATLVSTRTTPTDVRIGGGSGLTWHLRTAWDIWRSARPDTVYLSPTSYLVPALLGRRVACVPVVHDLIAFEDAAHDARARFIERLTLGRAVSHAAAICTISGATRSDLLRRFPGLDPTKIQTIFAGPRQPSPPLAKRDRAIILCIGTLSPRKNQARLVRAFGSLSTDVRNDWTLVLAGSRGWHDDDVLATVRTTPNVEWRSYVSEPELEDLLTHARVLAFPSLYEGFGLPVLDAFQRGLPVLTSSRGSLQELAGGGAFIVDPEDTRSIAHGLSILMTNANVADDLARRGQVRATRYSWAKSVDLLLEALASFR